MRQKVNDIIAISNAIGHPDIFITMTCNSYCPEVQNELLRFQKENDRPDLCNRVCCMEFILLLMHLNEDEPFGEVISFLSVIEFQKKGLVHAHVIVFLD